MSQLTEYQKARIRSAWVFMIPMLAVLALVALWPLLKTIFFGFTNVSIIDLSDFEWIGFQNYLEDFEGAWYGLLADELWWRAVFNTVWFSVVSVSIETVLGMIVALVLHTNFKGRGLLRTAILIPWAIPTIVSAKMWAWILNDQFGILNDILQKLGLIDEGIAWMASADTAMVAVIMVDVWKTTPFMSLLLLAGLQLVPKEIYEAAKVDGIGPIRAFFQITLPLIKQTLMVAIIFRTLDALRIFDLIYVLTPGNEATISMSVFARQNLFDFDKFAYGSAASTFLFLVISLITITYIKLGKVDLHGKT